MSKRLIRIPTDIIPEKWAEISGKKVNIVFNDGGVLLVTALDIKEGQLSVLDTRLVKQKILLKHISEIIIDY